MTTEQSALDGKGGAVVGVPSAAAKPVPPANISPAASATPTM
ncbi:MAG TPA: hypothetical protein VH352_18555 [Pseudonocardiaceae bacterium]|nr:hypothetical protein [Pseudonocardiaceae bacterium]